MGYPYRLLVEHSVSTFQIDHNEDQSQLTIAKCHNLLYLQDNRVEDDYQDNRPYLVRY